MKLLGVISIVAPFALGSLACSSGTAPAQAPAPLTSLPRALTTAEQKLIGGSNMFAFDLMRQINSAQHNDNVFVSPLSASMALGMASNGAAGTTYDAFHNTLRFGDANRQEVNEGYKSLISLLTGLDPSTDVRIANSIWFEKTFPFKDTFLSESKSFFSAQVQGLDFSKQSSVDAINGWVSDATAKKIPTIIDSIDPSEVMFLINAIYFKGSWQQKFDKAQTTDAPFRSSTGQSQTVPMMQHEGRMRFAREPGLSAVDLYYGNSAFAMTLLLPDSTSDINAVTESLSGADWNKLLGEFHEGEVDLFLPRFRIEWKRQLNDDLRALGLGVAFTDAADFTGMSDQGRRLRISRVIQKTYVDVNEEGTEAAAVTSVGIEATSLHEPFTVRFDRPFIFAIRERFSGTILFIGKIVKLPA